METSGQTSAHTPETGDDVVSAAERTAERIAEKLGASVRTSKVFGDPVERGDVTVIPVARARWGFGGGGGRSQDDQSGTGGGGGATMSPVGYIEIRGDGTTRFKRTVAANDIAAMAAVCLVASLVIARMVRTR